MKATGTSAVSAASLIVVGGVVAGAGAESFPFSQHILASDGSSADEFGISVGADDDVVIVGAHLDNDNGNDAGAAFIYRLQGDTWVEEQKLTASDGQPLDQFGFSVDVKGDIAVVSSAWDDDRGGDAGAVYVFRHQASSGQWIQEAKLLASDGSGGDQLGFSVSISGNTILAGAYGHSGAASYSGAAYVYRHNGVAWVQEQKLTAGDTGNYEFFGSSVAISGDVAMVGKYGDATNGSTSGSAYVFRYNGTSWVQEQKLMPAEGDAADLFGASVAASGNVVVAGALQDDDTDVNAGAAYVFRFNGSSWTMEQKLLAQGGTSWDKFGKSVDVDGNLVTVGAWWDDNDYIPDCGSAYVFKFDGNGWNELGMIRDEAGWFDDYFGGAVAAAGGHVICAAAFDDNQGNNSGSIFVFDSPDGDDDLPGEDCNGNGEDDENDIATGASDDCNENGVPDECEMGGPFAVASSTMGPIGNGSPQTFSFDNPGPAGADVVISVTARGDLSSGSEYIDVTINGVAVGTVFQSGGTDCVALEADIVVPAATYNNAIASANQVVVEFVASSGVNAGMCSSNNYVQADLASTGSSPLDEDGNGIMDACEDDVEPDACDSDISGNGSVGVEDLVAAILSWGACASPCDADVDGDGLVGVLDLVMILDNWGTCPNQDP